MSQSTARKHSREFKVHLVQRMLAGESVAALSQEYGVRRKLIYQWKDVYKRFGESGFRTAGRPKTVEQPDVVAVAEHDGVRPELLAARERIRELERKVGQQELELDFFAEALRRLRSVKAGEKRSTDSSPNEPRKAD